MPLITITTASPNRQVSKKARIAAEINRLSSNLLHKDPKVTAVIVTSVDPDDWFCGGRSLTDVGLASFWLDIHIVDGTNTKDEKAAFIAATFEAMGKILGPLHEESYVRDGGLSCNDPHKAGSARNQCQLLGVKRTSPKPVGMSANDPKRTLVTDVNLKE